MHTENFAAAMSTARAGGVTKDLETVEDLRKIWEQPSIKQTQ